jgi:hypothetical protein
MVRPGLRIVLGVLLGLALLAPLCPPVGAQEAPVADGLVPYVTPSAGTFRTDPRLVPGLDILARLDSGRSLVDGLARAGVTTVVVAEPRGVWAHYAPRARRIAVDISFVGGDPRTMAALLSHEAAHVREAQENPPPVRARATANACYADEYQAITTELQVWHELFGPEGKQPADHAYEREQNTTLARHLRDPESTVRVLRAYTAICGR